MPKLPGTGIVQGLGIEFAFAAKQVLLFGTAYKALAFLTDFPSKVGEAVGQLQTFRNTLKAISPSAKEAGQSSQFILDVVDKYNVPLQSARDGFTKLYASMQPAGFGGNEIRDLFLGISQAAATFGMSADKVDRVNYAFAQMASKGQVMSEELKGQLGDVLPGAMAIFAEAAGFKGPEAITKFSKALEDGAYKGGAMKTLLTNVGIVMRKEFGPGAEGAARTFQGSINRMQNSLKLFYEAFEPVAVGFLNAVVMPMTSGIKTLTDGFNAFFTGQAAQTTSGNVLAQQLEQLRPAFDGIRNNIAQILPLLQSFGKIALSLGSILLQIAGNPFVGYLARVYLAVLPLTIAIQALNLSALIPLIRNLLAAVPAFVAFTASQLRGMSTLGSFKAATYGLGLTAAATGVKIRLLSGIIKTAFATTVIGVALLGIGMLIEKLMMAGIKADEAKQKMLQFADSVKQAGQAGDVAGVTTTLAEEKGMAKRMQNAKALLEQIKKGKKSISEQQKQELEALGLASNLQPEKVGTGPVFKALGVKESKNFIIQATAGSIDANIKAAQQGYLEGQTRILQSQKALNVAKTKQVKEEKELEKIKLDGGDDGKKAAQAEEKQAKLQDTLANRQQQLDIDNANQEAALDQSSFDSRLRMSDAEYDYKKALQDSYFEREISGLDSIEARQKKFQQDLKAIENRRIDSIRKAELDSVKAIQELRSAGIKAGAVTEGAGGRYMQGGIGPKGKNQYGDHFHISRSDQANFDRSALDKYVSVNDKPLSSGLTVRGGEYGAGREGRSHTGIDYAFPTGAALSLKEGAQFTSSSRGSYGDETAFQTPDGKVYKILHGNFKQEPVGSRSSSVSLDTRSGAFAMGRREDKADNKLELEQQQAAIKLSEELLRIRYANQLAIEETITLVKQNLDNIFPVKEQQLENDLLRLRNDLESKGMAKEIIDMEVEKAKRTKESIYLLETYTTKIKENQDALDAYNKQKTFTTKDKLQMDLLKKNIDTFSKAKADIPKAQAESNKALTEGVRLGATSSFESTMTSLKNQMKMARAFTPGQELKTQIGLDHSTATPEQQQILFDTTQAKNALEELKQRANDTASNMSESLTGAFKNIVTGSMTMQEGLATSFRSISDFFADMVMKMIADYLKLQLIEGIKSIFSMFAPGAAPGEGLPGGLPSGDPSQGFKIPEMVPGLGNLGPQRAFKFADGGMVTGPTLGLVGEGRYNEAIIPLPDGKSVPVQLAGGTEGATAPINTNIVVNVKNGQADNQVTGNQGNQLGREIEGAVRQVILKESRPGGLIYGSR
jgi:tape measure domain-containing protein